MNHLLVIWLLSYMFIGLKATQQLNVVHNQRLSVLVVSFLLSACDITLIANYAQAGGHTLAVLLTAGSASGVGSLTAMWFHKRMRRSK